MQFSLEARILSGFSGRKRGQIRDRVVKFLKARGLLGEGESGKAAILDGKQTQERLGNAARR
jgi:hypothetical protein